MAKIRRLSWLPVVDQGCCCSLETCCKVQGYLNVIWSLVVLAVAVLTISMWTECHREDVINQASFRKIAIADCNQTLNMINSSIYFVIHGVLGFVFSTMFLVGIYQKRPQTMMPFIWLQHLWIISYIHNAILFAPHLPNISMYLTVPPIAFAIYCLVCANSVRLHMEQTQKGLHVLTEQIE